MFHSVHTIQTVIRDQILRLHIVDYFIIIYYIMSYLEIYKSTVFIVQPFVSNLYLM